MSGLDLPEMAASIGVADIFMADDGDFGASLVVILVLLVVVGGSSGGDG